MAVSPQEVGALTTRENKLVEKIEKAIDRELQDLDPEMKKQELEIRFPAFWRLSIDKQLKVAGELRRRYLNAGWKGFSFDVSDDDDKRRNGILEIQLVREKRRKNPPSHTVIRTID